MQTIRSPICCVLGHVDVGKTKLLDTIRGTSIQKREVRGITQKISTWYIDKEKIIELLGGIIKQDKVSIPGLLLIDTPGHECFFTLRQKGSNICDIVLVVIDINKGLEEQTYESLKFLKESQTPFIIVMNKVDTIYKWEAKNKIFKQNIERQNETAKSEFFRRYKDIILQLNQNGFNAKLYYENIGTFASYLSIIPVSAKTGEGIAELMMLITGLTQKYLKKQLVLKEQTNLLLLDIKEVKGYGLLMETILVNGKIKSEDSLICLTEKGPVNVKIKNIYINQAVSTRDKSQKLIKINEVFAAANVNILCEHLPARIVTGTNLYTDLTDEITTEYQEILEKVKGKGVEIGGISIKCDNIGSMEALIYYLGKEKIPIGNCGLGSLTKKDIFKMTKIVENNPENAVILAFNVKISEEIKFTYDETDCCYVEKSGIRIFVADHLFTLIQRYQNYQTRLKRQQAQKAIFSCTVKILPKCIFNKHNPLIFGVELLEGILRPLVDLYTILEKVNSDDKVERVETLVGTVLSIQQNSKDVPFVRKGAQVAIKVESTLTFGRQLAENSILFTKGDNVSEDLANHLS